MNRLLAKAMEVPIFRNDYLKPLQEHIKKYKIIAVDTEDDSKGNFIRACFMTDNETVIIDSQPYAKKWIVDFAKDKKAKGYLLLAHNLGYDLVNLLYPFDNDIELIMNSGRLLSAKMFNLLMYDTFNHSFTNLAKVGETIGINKLEFAPTSEKYIIRDTEIVFKYGNFLQDMYNQYEITFPLSLASGALKIWRRLFQKSNIRVMSNELLDMLRDAYFGGRVEAFFIGEYKGKIKYYDVNSMYPFVMENLYTDIDTLHYVVNPDSRYRGVCYAKITIPPMQIPPIPLRLEDRSTIYPYGTIKGFYTTLELDYCEYLGCKVQRLFGYVSINAGYIFKDYITHFYLQRMKAQSPQQKLFYKLLMNSLYGKFGTGKEKRIIRPYSENIKYDYVKEIFLGKYVLEVVDEDYPIYSNIWAYEVTAYARILLHRLLLYIQEQGGMILYCDTDSIIYSGDFQIPDSKDIGKVKLEGTSDRIEIFGAKEYIFNEKAKAKGIPKEKQKEYLYKGNTMYQKPVQLLEGFRRGIRPNIWTDTIKVKSIMYDKRIILKDGFTEPWKVENNVPCKTGTSSGRSKARVRGKIYKD